MVEVPSVPFDDIKLEHRGNPSKAKPEELLYYDPMIMHIPNWNDALVTIDPNSELPMYPSSQFGPIYGVWKDVNDIHSSIALFGEHEVNIEECADDAVEDPLDDSLHRHADDLPSDDKTLDGDTRDDDSGPMDLEANAAVGGHDDHDRLPSSPVAKPPR